MINVVIADDHKMVLQGLKMLLESGEDIEVTGTASDGREALEAILEKKPDIAILDISMPEIDGIELVNEIKRRELKTKVILCTAKKDPQTADIALKAGTSGFLLKDSAFDELLSAIKIVQEGKEYIGPSIAMELLNYRSEKGKNPSSLTPREEEILTLIALGLSNKQIAAKLFISVKTVETHRTKVMQKLDLHCVADLVRYAMKAGLVDQDDA